MYSEFTKNYLYRSYQAQLDKLLSCTSLSFEDVSISRSFFEANSLELGLPIPSKLNTYCIVGGVPFSLNEIKNISNLTDDIKQIIGDDLSYFVEPSNLGVELAILKWPDSPLVPGLLEQVLLFMDKNPPPIFNLDIEGFQFHKDGCLVLRGFDRDASFRMYRYKLLNEIGGMPDKQSSWCHIPLGRLLTSLNSVKYSFLSGCASESQTKYRFSIQVDSLQVLH